MIELSSVHLKTGDTTRILYFRPHSSDVEVIEQIFKSQDYDLRRLRRFPEIARFLACASFGPKKPLIVDAGANIGASPIYFKVKSPDALVVAIEPDNENYQLLQENTQGLSIVPLHAALASTKTRVEVIDAGEGFWGYQTRLSRDKESDGIDTTTINEIYRLYEESHFPFLVKIDIEGGEKEVFSGNVEWVERTPLIIIELHDWLLGGQNTAGPFLQCVARLNRDFVYIGENIFSIANNLDELLTSMTGESLGTSTYPPSRQRDSEQSIVDATQKFQVGIALIPQTGGEAEENLAKFHPIVVNDDSGSGLRKQKNAPGNRRASDSDVGIFSLPSSGERSRKLTGTAHEVAAVLEQELADNLQKLSESKFETQHVRVLLADAQRAAVRLDAEATKLRRAVAKLDAEADGLSSQLEQLLHSTSWKISAPIRIIGRRLPRVARFSRTILSPFWHLIQIVSGRSESMITRDPIAICTRKLIVDEGTQISNSDSIETFVSLQSRIGRNVVFVAADTPPMLDRHAGGLRLYNLIRLISEMGFRVVFSSQFVVEQFTQHVGSPEHRKRYEELLYDAGVDQITYGAEQCVNMLRALGSDIRWAFLSFPSVAEQFIPAVRIHAPWANVIYDMVDFHYLRMSREAKLASDAALQENAERIRISELTNAKAADLTVAVSEEERQALLEMDSKLAVEVIPTFFELPENARLEIEGRSGLLYIGGFLHSPNIDAVLWFYREVWPLVRKERQDMIFRVVGSHPSEQILALRGQPGIEVVGYLQDLTDVFAYSRMSVAPLRFGAGVKGKVGQSMAYGLPVVATSIGAEGMALEHEKHLLIADEPEEFATAVLRLATDDELWRRLQTNGRHFIQESQSMDAVRDKIRALMHA